ncbi:cyclin-dependent kinase 4 [Plodia interpunctella]|uniref:cyclin-dependent kinase 4 n=1 Tax=Plodia interpunctella TaxID=58824 RepID=UPI00236811E0|nr:cyclin-dependent kinase 4 [Plodia interpunctella]
MSSSRDISHSPSSIASDVSSLFQNPKKYEELNVIGTGAYGTVYKARDLHNGGQVVAMKKVKVAITEDGIPLSTLREIALLRQLEAYRHPNIVRLLDVCHGAPSVERDQQLLLYLVFEHVEQDLESYLKRAPGPLSENRIRCMSHDILSGIDFLHAHRIVHRDLKPHNLLVTASGRVKLADFGLAKTYDTEMKLTSVVVTLWYRPPEVLLGVSYNTAVDVWSCGCVLAQLHTRSPLLPGTSDSDQLHCIFRLIGRPSRREWPDAASVMPDSFPDYPPTDFADIFPNIHPHALELIRGMLIFDPTKRLTALDCLEHPYFTDEPLT